MFWADNLGFFVGLNDFKFVLKSHLQIVLWMALDDFLGDFLQPK